MNIKYLIAGNGTGEFKLEIVEALEQFVYWIFRFPEWMRVPDC